MIAYSSVSDILDQYLTRVQDILNSSNMINLVFFAGLLIMMLACVLFVTSLKAQQHPDDRSSAPWLKFVAAGIGLFLALPGAVMYDNMLKSPHLDLAEAQLDSALELHVVMEYDTVTSADVVERQMEDNTDELRNVTMQLTVEDHETITVDMVPEDDVLVPIDVDILPES